MYICTHAHTHTHVLFKFLCQGLLKWPQAGCASKVEAGGQKRTIKSRRQNRRLTLN